MSQLLRELAVVRDGSGDPSRRAFAAAALAAGACDAEGEPRPADAAQRMFGFGTRHDDAAWWDGRGPRSGTLTYVDDERIEQYVGPQRWIAYRCADLAPFAVSVGDQVRICARAGASALEHIGPNRLDENAAVREVRSGLVLLRTTALELPEIESFAPLVAERYGAGAQRDGEIVRLDFGGNARLVVVPVEPAAFSAGAAIVLLGGPVRGACRFDVHVRSNRLDAAADAERALMLFAAMLLSTGDGIAVDDTGAHFSAQEVSVLGTRNEMRADAFAFAAAAAQRRWPAAPAWISDRTGICDELTVCYRRPWRADFAARFLERELAGLAAGAALNDDPVVPADGEILAVDDAVSDGSFVRLARLWFETVELDIGFVAVTAGAPGVPCALAGRRDIEALLGGPATSAVVIAFGSRGEDTESDRFGLEMRRAETLATALAASLGARGESIATDAAGVLYAPADLLTLALRRCGKSAALAARVARVTSRHLTRQ